MSFDNKKVYEIAKKYVFKELGNFDLFDPISDNDEQDNFALACLRLLFGGPETSIDPNNNKKEFAQTVKKLKLNELGGKDLGFGTGNANNLIYRLFIAHIKSLDERQKSKTKIDFMKRAYKDELFFKGLAVDNFNEPEVYKVITKQAFYNWHYENFIKYFEYDSVIKTKSDLNLSKWQDSNPGENVTFFIDQSGGPFNSGVPTVCCVIQEEVVEPDKIFNNKDAYIKKCFDKIFPIFGKKKYSDLTDAEKKDFVEEFVLSKAIDHTKLAANYLSFSFVKANNNPNSNLYKICVGADYANLIFGISGDLKLPEKSYKQMSQVKQFIANKKTSRGTIKSIPEDKKQTTDIWKESSTKLSNILNKKNDAIQKGPALFFDLEDGKEVLDAIKENLEKYELVDQDASTEIFKAQYSPSGVDFSQTITGIYSELLFDRFLSNRLYFLELISEPNYREKVFEDVVFYYSHPELRLLAVGAKKRPSKEIEPDDIELKIQKNNVPFEFSGLVDDKSQNLYIPEINNAYSVIPQIDKDEKGELDTGFSGEIIFTTEFLIDEILKSNDAASKNLIDSETKRFKNELFDVVSFKEMQDALPALNNSFANVLLTTGNGFFLLSKEQILASEKEGGVITFLKDSLSTGVDFFTSNNTFKDEDVISLDNISAYMQRYHFPPLLIKPTVPKQESATVEDQDAGLIKPREPNSLGAPKEKKEKVYDLDSYNSWYKNAGLQITVKMAQVSELGCLEDLGKIISQGTLDQVFEFLLTKFPWDELVLKSILADLKSKQNLLDPETNAAMLDQINECFDNADKLMAEFARFLDLLQNFDNILKAQIPQVPSIPELPYLYVLDFQAFFRKFIQEKLEDLIKSLIGEIVALMLKEILGDCSIDTDLERLFNEKLKGDENKTDTGADIAADDQGGLTGSTSSGAPNDLNNSSIDLVNILRASRIENLDNIFNGVYDLFPVLRTIVPKGVDKTVFIQNYLSALSDSMSAIDTKSLLTGVAEPFQYDLVKDFTNNYGENSLKAVFLTQRNIALLFKYLRRFINLILINQQIVNTSVIIPDPCFVNFGKFSDQDLQILKDSLGPEVTQEIINTEINGLTDLISGACDKIAKALNGFSDVNSSIEGSFISDSSKKALNQAVDSSIDGIVSYQNRSKAGIKKNAVGLVEIYSYLYLGNGEKERFEVDPLSINDGFKLKESTLKNAVSKEADVQLTLPVIEAFPKVKDFYVNSIGLNSSAGKNKNFLNKQFSISDASPPTELDDFFRFLALSTFLTGGQEQLSLKNIVNSLSSLQSIKVLFDEADKVFSDPKDLRKTYKETFDDVVAEGGKNTNVFITNLKKMKQIINNQTIESEGE